MNRSSRLIPCDDATQATTQWITMNSKNTSAICVMMYHVLIGFSRGLTNDYSDMRSSIWSSAMPHPFRKIGPRRRCSRIASLPRRSYHIFTGWWFEPYPSEKSWSSSMGRMTYHKLIYINILIYIWKIKAMFQTTKQFISSVEWVDDELWWVGAISCEPLGFEGEPHGCFKRKHG